MKKCLILIFICIAMTLGLAACSEAPPPEDNNPPANPNLRSIGFNLNGFFGSPELPIQYKEIGEKVSEPQAPERMGYSFEGWYTNAAGGEQWDFDTPIADYMTLWARWALLEFTVTFDLAQGEGETPQAQTVNYLEYVEKPALTPEKEGFVFAGWWKGASSEELEQEWNFATDITLENITLYVGWAQEGTNSEFNYLELDNCIKITGYPGDDEEEESLTIPNTIDDKPVLSIGENAFSNSYKSSITLPDSLTTINKRAFYRCINLGVVDIPDSVTSIGEHAFESCEWVYNVKLGTGVRVVGKRAFYGCKRVGFTQSAKLKIPSNVIIIQDEAFNVDTYENDALEYLEFNYGIEVIGESAFRYTNILKIKFPDSLHTIGDEAFYKSQNLRTIEIGKGIKSIGSDAFKECHTHVYVVIYAKEPPVLGSSTAFGQNTSARTGFFITIENSSSLSAYKTAPNWSSYASVMIGVIVGDKL